MIIFVCSLFIELNQSKFVSWHLQVYECISCYKCTIKNESSQQITMQSIRIVSEIFVTTKLYHDSWKYSYQLNAKKKMNREIKFTNLFQC